MRTKISPAEALERARVEVAAQHKKKWDAEIASLQNEANTAVGGHGTPQPERGVNADA